MNLTDWQPQSDYFKRRRLRAIRWVEEKRDELGISGSSGNGRGRSQVPANVEGHAEGEKEQGTNVFRVRRDGGAVSTHL